MLRSYAYMNEQHVFKSRRIYNRWVANQTMEDFALRFTAKTGRRWSIGRVSNTALGAISFLALEAIGGAITVHYGFHNALVSTLVVSMIIFLTGLPISYYAARYGVDIDLLSRGAGFGYIGSTITSLIYASFTFIFFALEAAIMSSALEILFGLPLTLGYLLSSLVIIPMATHGITFINVFQFWSQPLWLILQLTPFVFILVHEWSSLERWTHYQGPVSDDKGFNVIFFGAASGILFSLMAQIGEQVDFLRFLPKQTSKNRMQWWIALISAGPGWIIVGLLKILAGSFLAVLAIEHGIPENKADDPIQMYLVAFSYVTQSPNMALALAGIFVIICQLKINVTNAYAGSIAWSNFFSRLTHTHPGRVVWLVFNVIIALLLMELGVYQALENILGIYSNVAVAWVGALVADLVINKQLGYSPKHIEFKRAHLYDINPVGLGAMLIASFLGIVSYVGMLGEIAQAFSPYISLFTAFIVSPLIAIATRGKYYLARESNLETHNQTTIICKVCQNAFEVEDMTSCPAYHGAICSLCCSLDARCHDQCKQNADMAHQITQLVSSILPQRIVHRVDRRLLHFSGLLVLMATVLACLFWLVFEQAPHADSQISTAVASTLSQVYLLLLIIVGIFVWLYILANESREFALEESQRQTQLLSEEIEAHTQTDLELQKAKETAEAANTAKSRYLTGISHELRSPLNTILGYAQLLEKDQRMQQDQQGKLKLIRRSGDHLANLIEGLLDISRIEAGKLELHKNQVHFPAFINELIEMFLLQAQAKGIEFEYRAQSRLPSVVIADEKHLKQILINLLSNAIKYTVQGKVSLSVRYRSHVAEFTVKDSGVGIAAEQFDKIFEPFERIVQSNQVSSPGTGLGLTISKFLTEIMGGEISLESMPGKGSTFRLSLYLASVDEPLINPEPTRRITSYIGTSKTILVVDDEPAHRGLIRDFLTPLKFNVLEMPDANACLETPDFISVDLYLLDISMPGMNGWELLVALREKGVDAPIIMVSADAIENSQFKPAEVNNIRLNDDYLTKPVRHNILLDKISSTLNLQWVYEDEQVDSCLREPVHHTLHNNDICLWVTPDDFRELIAMAELGYVEGVENTLNRLEEDHRNRPFTKKMRQFARQYQFSQIVSASKQALNYE